MHESKPLQARFRLRAAPPVGSGLKHEVDYGVFAGTKPVRAHQLELN